MLTSEMQHASSPQTAHIIPRTSTQRSEDAWQARRNGALAVTPNPDPIPSPNPNPTPNPTQARCNGALAVIRLLQRYGTSPTPLAVATVWP